MASSAPCSLLPSKQSRMKVPHLITLADLSPAQINRFLIHSHNIKRTCLPLMLPIRNGRLAQSKALPEPPKSLENKTIALVFSKRSTRTRLAAETSTSLLGGDALFLAPSDIQLGVNESYRDSARVIGGMCQGIFARVGKNEEVEELAKHSPVPVLNALSDLWHPTQILADFLTLREHAHRFTSSLHPLEIPFPNFPVDVDLVGRLDQYSSRHPRRVPPTKPFESYPCSHSS